MPDYRTVTNEYKPGKSIKKMMKTSFSFLDKRNILWKRI